MLKITGSALALTAGATAAFAQEMPAPVDNPGDVKIALVRYLSTGDFFRHTSPAESLKLPRRCGPAGV